MKRLIVTADDFGLSEAVNEAVERAHRDGILTTASLMVAGPAAADAVRRARAMPSLRVGLHLVVIEGPAVLRQAIAPAGEFPSQQLRLGVNYFFRPAMRRQLAAEIRAQFEAFAATGLALDHANAHKHMHLHPTVGRLMIDIGRQFGLRAVRVPAEPVGGGVAHRALHAWTRLLRHQARRAGLAVNDHCFGIRWTGAMTADRLVQLIGSCAGRCQRSLSSSGGVAEARLAALMPNYAHEAELAALLDPAVREALAAHDVRLLPGFGALT